MCHYSKGEASFSILMHTLAWGAESSTFMKIVQIIYIFNLNTVTIYQTKKKPSKKKREQKNAMDIYIQFSFFSSLDYNCLDLGAMQALFCFFFFLFFFWRSECVIL